MFQIHAARCFLRPAATDFASTSRIPTTASCPPRTLRTFLSTMSDSNERRAFATCRPRPSTTADVRSTSGISRKEAREGSRVVFVDFLFMTSRASSADESEYSAADAKVGPSSGLGLALRASALLPFCPSPLPMFLRFRTAALTWLVKQERAFSDQLA